MATHLRCVVQYVLKPTKSCDQMLYRSNSNQEQFFVCLFAREELWVNRSILTLHNRSMVSTC